MQSMNFNGIKHLLISLNSERSLSLNIFVKPLVVISLDTLGKILDHLNKLVFENSVKKGEMIFHDKTIFRNIHYANLI